MFMREPIQQVDMPSYLAWAKTTVQPLNCISNLDNLDSTWKYGQNVF